MGSTGQRDPDGKAPLAFSTAKLENPGDRLILVIRSGVWDEKNVDDLIATLDGIGLAGRYAILYLDDVDEVHVVRGG